MQNRVLGVRLNALWLPRTSAILGAVLLAAGLLVGADSDFGLELLMIGLVCGLFGLTGVLPWVTGVWGVAVDEEGVHRAGGGAMLARWEDVSRFAVAQRVRRDGAHSHALVRALMGLIRLGRLANPRPSVHFSWRAAGWVAKPGVSPPRRGRVDRDDWDPPIDGVLLWDSWISADEAVGALNRRLLARSTTLTPDQQACLLDLVRGCHPDELGQPDALWTRGSVIQLIHERFGIQLPDTIAARYLRDWGYSPAVHPRKALQHDPQGAAWLEDLYPDIRVQAKRDGGMVLWLTQTRISHEHVISAIGNDSSQRFSSSADEFDASTLIDFLARLVRHHRDRKVHVIVDAHPAYAGESVQRWAADHDAVIALHCARAPAGRADAGHRRRTRPPG